MKRTMLSIALALLVITISVRAGDSSSRFTKQHMKQTVANIISVLNDGSSPSIQASAAQTIRELEWAYPDESFSDFVDPLIRVVKDESTDTQVRILAAIALDGLHSDAGDAAIETVAKGSGEKSVQTLCAALLVRTGK
jgi:HEAT repeat protein